MSDVTPGALPLVVDLDGTLTPADTLAESLRLVIRFSPGSALWALAGLLAGRAVFKSRVSDVCRLPVAQLPWRAEFVQWLADQRANGRRIVLATAADHRIAHDVAQHLRLFDDVLATAAGNNLRGVAKLEAITRTVGPRFAYAGDGRADIPVWIASEEPIFVGVSHRVRAQATAAGVRPRHEFQGEALTWRLWLQAIRAHQWLKNVLLFVPLLTSFGFLEPSLIALAAVAFVAFSLTASGTYLLNDLWDLDADRQHPRKRRRLLASGRISAAQALGAAAALLVVGGVLAASLSSAFLGMLAGYVGLSLAYSTFLKRLALVDVITLALLHTFRVVTGAVVIDVPMSSWLLAFSAFLFFSLALVKRCAELRDLEGRADGAAPGRGYRSGDLVLLWPLGVGAGLCSVLVFCLYISSPEATSRYGASQLMWLIGVALLFGICRMWLKTARGEMHDDPVVFALRDRGTRLAFVAMVAIAMLAHWTA